MYLNGKPVLHAVDASTSFNGAKFLKDISSKEVWEILRMLWIDTYLGPPDFIVYDAGKQFTSKEFRGEARLIGNTCKEVTVEGH